MRPIIKKGDKVRFRTDGEVGELNRLLHYGEIIQEPYTVTEVLHDGMIQLSLSRMKYYSPIQFDICNGNPKEKKDVDRILRIVKKAPKPLLADAKVGDPCKRRDGKWVQIYHISDNSPAPIMCKSNAGGYDSFFLDGTCLWHPIDRSIIEWQPLAPEGTAEWAKQMMLLGRVISRTNNNDQWKLEFDSVYRYCIKNAKWLLEADIKCWTDLVIDTGWMVMKIPADFIPFHMHVQPTKFEVGQFVRVDSEELKDIPNIVNEKNLLAIVSDDKNTMIIGENLTKQQLQAIVDIIDVDLPIKLSDERKVYPDEFVTTCEYCGGHCSLYSQYINPVETHSTKETKKAQKERRERK